MHNSEYTKKPLKCTIQKGEYGISLAVQWLVHGGFTAVAWVQSLVKELRSYKPRGAQKQKKYMVWVVSQ